MIFEKDKNTVHAQFCSPSAYFLICDYCEMGVLKYGSIYGKHYLITPFFETELIELKRFIYSY